MKYIIANWKMNMTLADMENWLDEFSSLYKPNNSQNKILLATPAVHLAKAVELTKTLEVEVCAQDVSVKEKGAHTGEVGAFQLKDFCSFSIVGHSERKENREQVAQKRDMCLKNNITPIVCFTELNQVIEASAPGAVLAWEDPDNISKKGVYRVNDPGEIIKTYEVFAEKYPEEKILYGGSVNRQNVDKIARIPNVGGVLVGNASLGPKHFAEIIEAFLK